MHVCMCLSGGYIHRCMPERMQSTVIEKGSWTLLWFRLCNKVWVVLSCQCVHLVIPRGIQKEKRLCIVLTLYNGDCWSLLCGSNNNAFCVKLIRVRNIQVNKVKPLIQPRNKRLDRLNHHWNVLFTLLFLKYDRTVYWWRTDEDRLRMGSYRKKQASVGDALNKVRAKIMIYLRTDLHFSSPPIWVYSGPHLLWWYMQPQWWSKWCLVLALQWPFPVGDGGREGGRGKKW